MAGGRVRGRTSPMARAGFPANLTPLSRCRLTGGSNRR
jgi:hypothetical protein